MKSKANRRRHAPQRNAPAQSFHGDPTPAPPLSCPCSVTDSRLEPQHTDSSFVPNFCSQTQAQIVTWMHRHRQNEDAEWLQILVELSGILYSSERAHESRGAMLMRGGSHLAIATPTSTSASILFQVFHSFINVGKLILF